MSVKVNYKQRIKENYELGDYDTNN